MPPTLITCKLCILFRQRLLLLLLHIFKIRTITAPFTYVEKGVMICNKQMRPPSSKGFLRYFK